MEDLAKKLRQLNEENKANKEHLGFYADLDAHLANEIAAIEKQITEAEVTYSTGDRFWQDGDCKKMLVEAGDERGVDLIGLEFGDNYSGRSVGVFELRAITKGELNKIFSGNAHMYTRYWDNRKQEKC